MATKKKVTKVTKKKPVKKVKKAPKYEVKVKVNKGLPTGTWEFWL